MPSHTSAADPRLADPCLEGLRIEPVLPVDPAKIGDFWLDGRVHWRPAGSAFLAHGDGLTHFTRGDQTPGDQAVILVQLSEGAATDKGARDRFSGAVNRQHIDLVLARGGHEQDEGRLGKKFRSEDDDPVDPDDSHPLAPWAALALPGTRRGNQRVAELSEELLAEVDLEDLPPQGRASGPGFRLPWADRTRPGHNRVWPLPWPGRYDRAGWVSILISWLLMLVLAALAVLIAILLFHNKAPQSPPPETGQGTSTSSSSSSASPSPDPSGSQSASPSQQPSQDPSTPPPTPSGPGTPTPPSKL